MPAYDEVDDKSINFIAVDDSKQHGEKMRVSGTVVTASKRFHYRNVKSNKDNCNSMLTN